MDALGHNNGHFLSDLPAGKPVHGSILHQHRAGNFAKLPHNGFQDRGLSRAVRANEGDDLPLLDLQADILDQCLAVVAHGQVLGLQIGAHASAPFLRSII